MVSMEVVQFPSKVPVHGAYQLLCFGGMPMNTRANLKTVGSEAYVQFSTFVTYDAINETCICTRESFMEGVRCV